MLILVVFIAALFFFYFGCKGNGGVGHALLADEMETQIPEIDGIGVIPPEKSRNAGLPDRGIWPEYDDKISLFLLPGNGNGKTSIVIDKGRRVLTLMRDNTPIISYPIALGFSPEGAKIKRGDGKTPEGKYYLCQMLDKGLAPRYGKRAMRISYPGDKDAIRGLSTGLINTSQKGAIDRAILKLKIPPQNTILGSSIRIHGGGVGKDWTLGCIALRDEDVIDLYSAVKLGTKVHILGKNEPSPFGDMDRDAIPDQVDFLLGAKRTVLNGANYNGKYVVISPKGGDVPREIGVCTDVIIRAARNAGLDLQVEIQKERRKNPHQYPGIKKPDASIDHRRVKNMIPWFKEHWKSLPPDDYTTFLPGDIIFMDTLPAKGADHVGIISDRLGPSGRPLIINNWTVGYQTSEMDLLEFVPVLSHFRWMEK